jgi:nucleoid-associated protein YgaU
MESITAGSKPIRDPVLSRDLGPSTQASTPQADLPETASEPVRGSAKPERAAKAGSAPKQESAQLEPPHPSQAASQLAQGKQAATADPNGPALDVTTSRLELPTPEQSKYQPTPKVSGASSTPDARSDEKRLPPDRATIESKREQAAGSELRETPKAEAPGPQIPASPDATLKTVPTTSQSQDSPDAPRMENPSAEARRLVAGEPTGQVGSLTPAPPLQTPGAKQLDTPAASETERTARADVAAQATGSTRQGLPDLVRAGWVAIPITGKPLQEDEGVVNGREVEIDPESRAPSAAGAHADKNISFEGAATQPLRQTQPDQPGNRAGHVATDSLDGGALPLQRSRVTESLRSEVEPAKVEVVPHVVASGENFWTISRLYYSSGRYYKALWKANSQKFPDIRKLHVGNVLLVPPVEDLDASYIASARARPSEPGDDPEAGVDTARRGDTPSSAGRQGAPLGARTNELLAAAPVDGIPARPANRPSAVLDLPVGDVDVRRDGYDRRAGAGPMEDAAFDDAPEMRVTARPRATARARKPGYKVRPNDTLRSIARDTLGDAHRAGEILELNKDIIDDPNRLIAGQVIKLP